MAYEEWQAWVARTPHPGREAEDEQVRCYHAEGGRAATDPLLTIEEMHLAREGYKVAAIKRIRTRLGLSLSTARAAITEYVESLSSGAWR
jgi:ribosomal protein L7/L12